MPNGKTLIFMQHGRSAGNALCAMLQEEFGDAAFFKLGVVGERTSNHDDFLAAAKENSHRVYGGHFCYGVHRHIRGKSDYITTIREPIERVLSNYQAWGYGRGYTIEQWLDHDYDSNNGMVRRHIGGGAHKDKPYDFLADRPLDRDLTITDRHLQQAFDSIERDFPVVLLHSHLIESTVMLGRHYGLRPLFSLQRQFHNHLAQPIRVEDYPSPVIDKIIENNRFDRLLYEALRKRFLERLAAQPKDFPGEVRIMRMLAAILSQRGVQKLEEEQILARLNSGLNQLIQAGQQSDAVRILRCITGKGSLGQAFCFKALEIIGQIGTPEDLSAEATTYQARFGLDPAVQAMVA